MAKIRVYELAKKMGIPSNQLLEELKALGVEVKSNFSTLDETAMAQLGGAKKTSARGPEAKQERAQDASTKQPAVKQKPAPVPSKRAAAAAKQAGPTARDRPRRSTDKGRAAAVRGKQGANAEPGPSGRPQRGAGKPGVAPERGQARPAGAHHGRVQPQRGKEAQPSGRPVPGGQARPAPRPAVQPEARRKTKRERRMEKLQAKVDRRERLQQELVEAQTKAEKGEAIFIREGISVKELAEKLNVKVKDIIGKLMMRGILATINQPLDGQVAIQVSSMFGFAAEIISFEDEMILTQEEAPDSEKAPRAPVVTVMGHVDHGKSSLLEAIHDVDITGKEHGGITQHIGAYKVITHNREYVFLDTPGHEAFTLMRARGAQVTDIVILVVAADDGVMPQTIEAINHCKAANVPMVVAINKIDKPGADPEKVKKQLTQHGVQAEDWGGDVVTVPVSAKTGKGVGDMLDMVGLVADMLNLDAYPDQNAMGTVLESRLDRARGSVATVLVQDGTLKVGDLFLCGATFGHVRSMFDDKGERTEHAGPSTPVEVLGFSEVPAVGSVFQGMDDEAKARQVASFRKEQNKAKSLRTSKVRLDNVLGAIQQGEIQELSLIIKADVHGSLEAIAQQVEELSTDEVKVAVVHKGVGAVSESDVLLASASNALIIGFNVRPERKAADVAKSEDVEIDLFTVIYDLVDRLKQALSGMLKPIEKEVVLGHAEVKEIFRIPKVGTVAGCMVEDGRIVRSSLIRVLRDNVVIHSGKLSSLKRFKDDAAEVKEGLECGMSLENFNDVKPGDVLEAYEVKYQERTL